jgi:hypothetical protein
MNAMINMEVVRRVRYTMKWRGAVATSVLLGIGCISGGQTALGQAGTAASDAQTRTYNISAQNLGPALQEFAAQAGLQLLFSESDVAGLRTGGLQGTFTKNQALGRLLAGSGLAFEFPKPDAVIIRRPGSSADSASTDSASGRAAGAAAAAQKSESGRPTVGSTSRGSSSASASADSQSAADFQEVIVTGRAGVEQRTKEETSYSVTSRFQASGSKLPAARRAATCAHAASRWMGLGRSRCSRTECRSNTIRRSAI